MISRTKFEIAENTLVTLFEKAGITGVEEVRELGAGEFNAVYSAKADGREYAVKIAPGPENSVLTFEKDMLGAEVFWYERIREHTNIRVPDVYYTDYSKELIPTSYFIMEKLNGIQLDEMELSEEEQRDAATQMAEMAAQIHKIKNDKYGYVQTGLHGDWYQAIRAIVVQVLKDVAAMNERTERGERLLSYIDQYKEILKKAECVMVNFDIFTPNIIGEKKGEKIMYSWIDPERSFWGDRVADFVALEMFLPLAEKKTTLEAYNKVADAPVLVTREESIRYAIMVGYLAVIMDVEKHFRYRPELEGWKRNEACSTVLYDQAFDILEKGISEIH